MLSPTTLSGAAKAAAPIAPAARPQPISGAEPAGGCHARDAAAAQDRRPGVGGPGADHAQGLAARFDGLSRAQRQAPKGARYPATRCCRRRTHVHKKCASCGSRLDPVPGLITLQSMASFKKLIPDGDNRERSVCTNCGFIAYENPKVVVGSVIGAGDSVLMCRRAIEPRSGFWTIPAGYLELGETLQEGAAREALEEAEASIAIDGILGVFSIARIDQVQVIFRARFAGSDAPAFAPGPESQEVRLFAWDDIPWDEIAFPSVHWALHAWRGAGSGPPGQPAGNPPHDLRGMHRWPPSAAEQPGEAAP